MLQRVANLFRVANRHGLRGRGWLLIACPMWILLMVVLAICLRIAMEKESPFFTNLVIVRPVLLSAPGKIALVRYGPGLIRQTYRALFPELVPIVPSGVAPDHVD